MPAFVGARADLLRAGLRTAPPGFVYLVDDDGFYLTDPDGAYLMEAA